MYAFHYIMLSQEMAVYFEVHIAIFKIYLVFRFFNFLKGNFNFNQSSHFLLCFHLQYAY